MLFLSGMATLSGSTKWVVNPLVVSPFEVEYPSDRSGEIGSEGHCTIIYASSEEKVLAGGNEDWDDPSAQVRFVPAGERKNGIVYFGFADSGYEAGMNDQGLFFDAAATSPMEVTGSLHKPSSGSYPVIEVMETSSTVDEALAVFDQYNLTFMEDFQLLFGDRFGNSAILEGDQVIHKEGRYQIMTNFYQSQLPEGILPGQRYRRAESMFEATSDISIELFRMILDATHQEGRYPTQYSNVYDLKNRKMYVFYQHDYDRVLEIDLESMLKQGAQSYALSTIFETAFQVGTPTPMVLEPNPSPDVLKEQSSSNESYFWLGLVPPLVILILGFGAGYLHRRRLN